MRLPITLCLLLALVASASAQQWPNRAVRVVTPYAPGGITDSMARILANHLTHALGQPFVVENRVGAGGAIASEFVAKSSPDGYTLYFASTGQVAIQPHVQKLNFDALRDFAPISPFGISPFVLGISSIVPAKTVKEFVDYVKARPGALNFGSGGNGSVGHLTGAMFLARAGLIMTHVPYKGAAPSAAALVAGQIEMVFSNFADVVPHAKDGRITIIGVSSEKRDRRIPDVPAIAESYPGFSSTTWNGLLAPAGTPKDIIEKLAQECTRATRDPAIVDRLFKMAVDPACSTPSEFAAAIQKEFIAYRDAAQAAGMKPE